MNPRLPVCGLRCTQCDPAVSTEPTWKNGLSAQMVLAVEALASLALKSAASVSAPAGKYTAHATSAWHARMQHLQATQVAGLLPGAREQARVGACSPSCQGARSARLHARGRSPFRTRPLAESPLRHRCPNRGRAPSRACQHAGCGTSGMNAPSSSRNPRRKAVILVSSAAPLSWAMPAEAACENAVLPETVLKAVPA